ncbi:MAG: 4Fe-4S binding protein [Negativicutes bacterium]|nr:4Fe-4S binding protein [Negativicutes bacterium]
MKREEIEQAVSHFWAESKLNIVEELNSLRIFDCPLLGVAAADDPLFAELKADDAVGPQHMLPADWLPGARAVVAYFLPFSKEVREANRSLGLPSREWLYGRIEGEALNHALRRFLVDWFRDAGYEAATPALDERFKVVDRRSNWSERHVAYVAGLGTLSLSCSIITRRGSAGRLGSVIVSAPLEATPRPYTYKDEYCTKCGACIRRCPPLAISETGKDHAICGAYVDQMLERFRPRYGCGKCQTAVPCEAGIPGHRQ